MLSLELHEIHRSAGFTIFNSINSTTEQDLLLTTLLIHLQSKICTYNFMDSTTEQDLTGYKCFSFLKFNPEQVLILTTT